jgi:hypothetical protein
MREAAAGGCLGDSWTCGAAEEGLEEGLEEGWEEGLLGGEEGGGEAK